MCERLRNMLIKEFLQVLRDPRMRGVIFVMPLLQVMVFGYAVTTDVRNVPVAVLDLDKAWPAGNCSPVFPLRATSGSLPRQET